MKSDLQYLTVNSYSTYYIVVDFFICLWNMKLWCW